MKSIAIVGALALLTASSAWAQSTAPAGRGAAPVQGQTNTTGNDPSVVVPRGPTGADTLTTNSAAGGNAGQPSRAVPQGSANGGSSNR